MESKVVHFTIPRFEDIPVSTRTSIVMTNLILDIRALHQHLPIMPYIVVPKRRGRKAKGTPPDPNRDIPDGSIITVDFENTLRGVRLKKKKKSAAKKGEDYFRNSVTIVMVLGGKNINFKISRNGKFQITGCKTDDHAENCVKYIWTYIKDHPDNPGAEGQRIYKMDGPKFKALFIPAMRNIDFGLGFNIDREKLDKYFNTQTEYKSLLETSIGYTGVNIKIPFKKPITELYLKELTWNGSKWGKPKSIPFYEYLDMLKPKEKEKKLKKNRYHTFLVFHSGKIIMSSLCEDFARDTYYEFMDIIRNNHSRFEEKLDT
jgi:TATA-box binding protein (TBP) (component of TFIID and TFIIIB)